MIPAINEFNTFRKQWRNHSIILFLDFDGTLTPIVETPAKAFLSEEVKSVINALSKKLKIQLVVISGRSLNDIQQRVGIEEIIYVGNHGFEIKGLGMAFVWEPSTSYKDFLELLKKEIEHDLITCPNVFIEDKGITLSIHYRQVDQEQEIAVEEALYRLTQPYIANGEIHINIGKKVFEIKPPLHWDKGKAVMWILERRNGFPVYIGDDTTDEDAFLILKNTGITIHVGDRKDSYAQYCLKNTDEVIQFLKLLNEADNHD